MDVTIDKEKSDLNKQVRSRPRWGRFMKRSLDVVASLLGLIILSPVFAWVALAIRRSGPGPVYYRGKRLGKDGKPFEILKFRTMLEAPESYAGPPITAEDDERITPLGRKLRNSKINELPQMWNVLRGEMSLVGPRPEEPEVASRWSEALRQEILSVRPGITSPASVLYRHEEQMLQSASVWDDYFLKILPNKQRLDILYVRTHTFFSDLDILFLTLISLFPVADDQPIPESSFFSGFLDNIYRRYITWFVTDTLVAFLAAGLVGGIWRLNAPLNIGWSASLIIAIAMAVVFSLLNTLLGLGRVFWQKASPNLVFDLAFSCGLATLLIFVMNMFLPRGKLVPSGMVIEIGIIALIGFIALRYRQRLLTGLANRWLQIRRQANTLGERLLIIGAGDCGQLAGWLLQKSNLAHAFNVVGMVDDDPRKYKMRVDGYSIIGSTRDLPALVERNNIGVILYAITRIDVSEEERILALCRSLPVRLVIIPDLIKILQDHLLPQELPDKEML